MGRLLKTSRPIPWDIIKKFFCPMGWDDFQKFVVPSHPIPWNHILLKYRFTTRIFAQLSIQLTVSIILLLCVAPAPNRSVPRTANHFLLKIFFSFCETRNKRSVEVYKGTNSDPALVPSLL